MRDSLKVLLKAGVQSYTESPRDKWLFDHASQIVLACAGIFWAREVLHAFQSTDVAAELEVCFERCKSQLTQLTQLVRGTLTKLQRKTVSTLITLDVHARDIVDDMLKNQTHKESDFGWQMQLRFYWEDEEDNCRVRQTTAFWYGYEYQGARLVGDYANDRCYMTLSDALHLKLGGAPAGQQEPENGDNEGFG